MSSGTNNYSTSSSSSSSPLSSLQPWIEQHEHNMKRRRPNRRADDIAAECRRRLIESLQNIPVTRATKLGLLLSGGVDSCAILQAAVDGNVRLTAAVTVEIVDEEEGSNNEKLLRRRHGHVAIAYRCLLSCWHHLL